MRLYMKIGTGPAGFYKVRYKRKPPPVGSRLLIRDADYQIGRYTSVLVDKIKDMGEGLFLYYAQRH